MGQCCYIRVLSQNDGAYSLYKEFIYYNVFIVGYELLLWCTGFKPKYSLLSFDNVLILLFRVAKRWYPGS